jgi:signal transduction histidine kinase
MVSLPRPLDAIPSIKLKLAVLLVGSGVVGLLVFWHGVGSFPPRTSAAAIVIALGTSQILAHGITAPLREMTAAARAMARGDYTRRVRATSRDEVGQLAVAFNQMAADLASADQQRRELIANVSHELRTPISALQGVLENIVDGVAAADLETLRKALTQTERLGRLVTELLADVVAEAEVAAAAAERKVVFRTEVRPPEATVYADRERLYQVVVNLLDNAVRHGPADGEVTVTAAAEAGRLVIEVADEGPGIPVEQRERVFERFTRGDRSTGGGTGLGLAIARWVVELHRGTISVVDSVADENRAGCRIRVTLPARPLP